MNQCVAELNILHYQFPRKQHLVFVMNSGGLIIIRLREYLKLAASESSQIVEKVFQRQVGLGGRKEAGI